MEKRKIITAILIYHLMELNLTSCEEYFDVILQRFEQVFANKDYTDWNLNVRKHNRTVRALFGEVIVKTTEGNDVDMEVETFKVQGNVYKKMPYKIQKASFCDTASADDYVYGDLARESDFPEKFSCPFEEGTYNVNGAVFPLENAPRNAFSSGDYMVEPSSEPPKKSNNGYFDVILDRFEQVQANKDVCDWDLKVKRLNRTLRALYGQITINEDQGNDITVGVDCYKKQGNEYRKMPYHVSQAPICNAFGEDPYVYADLTARSNLLKDIKVTCPLKAGTYTVDGAYFPLNEAPRTAFQSGDYMVEISFLRDEEILSVFRVYAMIINI